MKQQDEDEDKNTIKDEVEEQNTLIVMILPTVMPPLVLMVMICDDADHRHHI